ncbi:MAG: TrkA family potassium uptake protein [Deltaproteobacteria bacterium]|nr:TrkA family potassium uptake protein [Deltaproteobacteria bacterium]MCL5792437.1 TrkA family potassium uptake protein [Deltaproteobacteria bacterium]
MTIPKNIYRYLITLIIIIAIGTAGFMYLEQFSFVEAAYTTIVILSTVGYSGGARRLDPKGEIFAVFMIVIGIGFVTYSAGGLFRAIIEGELRETIGRNKVIKAIEQLKDHYILCGLGRIGTTVAKVLKNNNVSFIAIDRDASILGMTEQNEYLFIQGDGTDEEVLKKAGIDKARGLIAVMANDADNVYTVLTARDMNSSLFIISRAGDSSSISKLYKAGANRVISPYIIGGEKIAHSVIKPNVIDFMELAIDKSNIDLKIEELSIDKTSTLNGKTLEESKIRQLFDIIIIAVRKPDGQFMYNPASQFAISSGDILIAIGRAQTLEKLEQITSPQRPTK